MKRLLLIVSLFSFSFAQAEEFKIFDVTTNYALPYMASEKFAIDAAAGRSWAEITLARNYEEGAGAEEVYQRNVPGLFYDAETQTVNFDRAGEIIECAHVVQKGVRLFKRTLLKHNAVEMTGNCRFEKRLATGTSDKGFEVKKEERFQIFFVVD